MAYITTAVADEIINDSGNTLGWGGMSETASQGSRSSSGPRIRIEVIPFADDEQTYQTRPRYTDGVLTEHNDDDPKAD